MFRRRRAPVAAHARPGIDEEGPRDGDALLLPSAQAHAPLANQRCVVKIYSPGYIEQCAAGPSCPVRGVVSSRAYPLGKASMNLPHHQSLECSKSALRDEEETVRVDSHMLRSGPALRVLGLQVAYLEVK